MSEESNQDEQVSSDSVESVPGEQVNPTGNNGEAGSSLDNAVSDQNSSERLVKLEAELKAKETQLENEIAKKQKLLNEKKTQQKAKEQALEENGEFKELAVSLKEKVDALEAEVASKAELETKANALEAIVSKQKEEQQTQFNTGMSALTELHRVAFNKLYPSLESFEPAVKLQSLEAFKEVQGISTSFGSVGAGTVGQKPVVDEFEKAKEEKGNITGLVKAFLGARV